MEWSVHRVAHTMSFRVGFWAAGGIIELLVLGIEQKSYAPGIQQYSGCVFLWPLRTRDTV